MPRRAYKLGARAECTRDQVTLLCSQIHVEQTLREMQLNRGYTAPPPVHRGLGICLG